MPKGKNKKPKDPNAPKKAQSSYFLFSNERRPVIASESGQSVTEISKTISSEWKAMDPSRKKTYEDRALKLKEEYKVTLSEYEQTENYRLFQIKLSEWKQREKELNDDIKRRGQPPKKPKQPESMPKRPQSSYFVFSNERRGQMRDEYPDKKLTELSKIIAEEWKLKTTDDKKYYEDIAAQNKVKYNNEMEEYKKTEEYNKYMNDVNEFKVAKKAYDRGEVMPHISISLPRKPKDDKCPKRPLTSYFLYAKEVREATKQEFPQHPITEIAKEISKKWKVLSEDEKKPYVDEAGKLKEKYKIDLKEYEGSDAQLEYKKQLQEWKLECDRRKAAAKAKAAKKRMKKSPAKGRKSKKKSPVNKRKVRKQKMDTDSDSDSDSSSSSSGSDSDSDSSSGSSDSDSSGSSSESSD